MLMNKEEFEELLRPFNLSAYRKFSLYSTVAEYSLDDVSKILARITGSFPSDAEFAFLLSKIEPEPVLKVQVAQEPNETFMESKDFFENANYKVNRNKEMKLNSFTLKKAKNLKGRKDA